MKVTQDIASTVAEYIKTVWPLNQVYQEQLRSSLGVQLRTYLEIAYGNIIEVAQDWLRTYLEVAYSNILEVAQEQPRNS